jgi:hypothetical protein
MKPHEHGGEDPHGWSLQKLQVHVRLDHPSLEPPGIEQDASFRTLSAAHDREHPAPAVLPALPGLYERISLEFSSTWPGQCYLRFKAPGGAVTMVRLNAADRAVLAALLREEKA